MAEDDFGGGIIIFTLWYLGIAFNYIMGPIFERRRLERFKCHCRRAPCSSSSNSCDLPPYNNGNKPSDDSPTLPNTNKDENGKDDKVEKENTVEKDDKVEKDKVEEDNVEKDKVEKDLAETLADAVMNDAVNMRMSDESEDEEAEDVIPDLPADD